MRNGMYMSKDKQYHLICCGSHACAVSLHRVRRQSHLQLRHWHGGFWQASAEHGGARRARAQFVGHRDFVWHPGLPIQLRRIQSPAVSVVWNDICTTHCQGLGDPGCVEPAFPDVGRGQLDPAQLLYGHGNAGHHAPYGMKNIHRAGLRRHLCLNALHSHPTESPSTALYVMLQPSA